MQEGDNWYQKLEEKNIVPRGGYPDESDSDSYDNRSCEDRRYPGRRRHYQDKGGRLPDKDNQDRGYAGRGRPPDDRGPPDDGGPLMMEDPLMMVDPLMMEDLQEMEDHQDNLEDKDHQAHQDLLDQCAL